MEKGSQIDERKTKKVTFKDDSKKKASKDPFDLEGLHKVLKTMSNEMVEIKKQVAESSAPKKPFRSFKTNPSSTSQAPNTISNVEPDQEAEEDSPNEEEVETEEEIEVNGMWDFILLTEEEAQAMLVTTRSKNYPNMSITNHKQKFATPAKEKTIADKSKTSQTNPIPPDSQNTSKTLVISDTVKYNIVDDMEKT